MKRQNKIESALTETQKQEFLEELKNIPNLTLANIQNLVKEKFGIEVSLMGASTFKKNTYDKHLENLRKSKEAALMVKEVGAQESGSTLADAAAGLLSQRVFEKVSESLTLSDELDELNPLKLGMLIESLRREDRQLSALKLQIEKFKSAEAQKAKQLDEILNHEESKRKRKKGDMGEALSTDTINNIRSIYGLSPIKSGDEQS